jgi:hypothetical protein
MRRDHVKGKILIGGSLAAVSVLSACQSNASGCAITLAAVRQPASVRVDLRATSDPLTKVLVVTTYGATTTRRTIVTNAKGIATTSYELPRSAEGHAFSVTASVTRSSNGSTSTSVVTTTISL